MTKLTRPRKQDSPGPSKRSAEPRGRQGVRQQASSEGRSRGQQRGSLLSRDSQLPVEGEESSDEGEESPVEGEESDESEHESQQQEEQEEYDVAFRPAQYTSLAPSGGAYSRGGEARPGFSEWARKGKRDATSELSDCEGDPEEQREVRVSNKRIICTSVTMSVLVSVLVLVVGALLLQPAYLPPEKRPSTEPYPLDEIRGYIDQKLASLNVLTAEEAESIRNDLLHLEDNSMSKLAGMDGRIGDFQGKWEDIMQRLDELEGRLSSGVSAQTVSHINQRLEELGHQLIGTSVSQGKLEGITRRLEELDRRLNEGANAETVSNLQKKLESINQIVKDLGSKLSGSDAVSSKTFDDIKRRLQELDRRLGDGASAQTVSEMKRHLEELDLRLGGSSNSGEMWGDVEQRLKQLTLDRYNVQCSLSKLESEVGSLFVFKIISILSIVLVMVALLMVRRNSAADVPPPPHTSPFLANHRSLDQEKAVQPSAGTLERAVCVVHCDRNQHRLHKEQTGAVVPPGTKILEFTINSHTDIPRVPGARLYFVFIPFNERNIILETPQLGTGDLRLTTVQTLQGRGAAVVVVYVGDTGSAHISTGQLFNPYLKSIESHPVLSQLQLRGCVLSIQDRFLEHQRLHLKQLVAAILGNQS